MLSQIAKFGQTSCMPINFVSMYMHQVSRLSMFLRSKSVQLQYTNTSPVLNAWQIHTRDIIANYHRVFEKVGLFQTKGPHLSDSLLEIVYLYLSTRHKPVTPNPVTINLTLHLTLVLNHHLTLATLILELESLAGLHNYLLYELLLLGATMAPGSSLYLPLGSGVLRG